MRLSILGPPGSGKSTQADILSERCGWTHIYPGKLLRQEVESGSPLAPRIGEYLEAGSLVPTDVVISILEDELSQTPDGYILDGFPRNIEQALALEKMLQARAEKLDATIYLMVSEEEVFNRLLKRGRADDAEGIIRERLRVFHSETDPVIQYYRTKGVLVTVSGKGEPNHLANEILSRLPR